MIRVRQFFLRPHLNDEIIISGEVQCNLGEFTWPRPLLVD